MTTNELKWKYSYQLAALRTKYYLETFLRELQEKDHGDRLFGQPIIVQTSRNRKSLYCVSHAVMAMKK